MIVSLEESRCSPGSQISFLMNSFAIIHIHDYSDLKKHRRTLCDLSLPPQVIDFQ